MKKSTSTLTLRSILTPREELDGYLISNQEAKELVAHHGARNSGDHISGCISIDKLESYIAQMRDLLASKSLDLSGLEFYFGKTTDTDAGRMTFFLYPTVIDSDSDEHVPVDPIATTSDSLVTFKDVNETTAHDANLVGLNRSNMSPPRGNTL